MGAEGQKAKEVTIFAHVRPWALNNRDEMKLDMAPGMAAID
jgi:hypothetical protein